MKAGLEDSKAALLVIIGALKDGRKVVLALAAGQRESKESWERVLRDLFARGLKPWKVTVADGYLGIWVSGYLGIWVSGRHWTSSARTEKSNAAGITG